MANNKDTEKTVRTAIRNTRKAWKKEADKVQRGILADRHANLMGDLRHITHCEDARYCGWHA